MVVVLHQLVLWGQGKRVGVTGQPHKSRTECKKEGSAGEDAKQGKEQSRLMEAKPSVRQRDNKRQQGSETTLTPLPSVGRLRKSE